MPQLVEGICFVSETSEPQTLTIQADLEEIVIINTVFKEGIEVIFNITDSIKIKNCVFNNDVRISSSMSNCTFDDDTLTVKSDQRWNFKFFGIDISAQRHAIEIGDDSELIFRNCSNFDDFRITSCYPSAIDLHQNSKLIITANYSVNCEMNSDETPAIRVCNNSYFKLAPTKEFTVFNFGLSIVSSGDKGAIIDSFDGEFSRSVDFVISLGRLDSIAKRLGY